MCRCESNEDYLLFAALQAGLEKNFAEVKVSVVECPDLTKDPFQFPVKGKFRSVFSLHISKTENKMHVWNNLIWSVIESVKPLMHVLHNNFAHIKCLTMNLMRILKLSEIITHVGAVM